MSVVQFVVGRLLPWITLAVLLLGIGLRVRKWLKAPVGKITLYPSAKTGGALWGGVAKEVVLFRSLFQGDKGLWAGAWLFHVALALIFVGHLRVVTDFPALWAAVGMQTADVDFMSFAVGGGVGIAILAFGLYLLARRFTVAAARDASKTEDFVALLLLLAVIGTGDAMRFLTEFKLEQAREYFAGLVTFNIQTMPDSPLFWTHFALAQLLLMYIPFGKLLHVPGVFFSHPLLRRD